MRVGFPAVLGAASLGFVLGCSSGSADRHADETRTAEPPDSKTPPSTTPATIDPAKTTPLPPAPVKAEPSKTLARPDPTKARAARLARRQFGEALDEGRTASRAGDRARAALAFERALAMRPVDPQALCEAGWAHFQAGDLERASARLTRAVHGLDAATGAGEPRTLAACLYNLGRVAEERGPRDEALAHRSRS